MLWIPLDHLATCWVPLSEADLIYDVRFSGVMIIEYIRFWHLILEGHVGERVHGGDECRARPST